MRKWGFTSKPEHFRIQEVLVPGETLDLPTFGKFKFETCDLVFIYASSPVAQLIGKLKIEQLGLSFEEVNPRNDLRKWPRHHSSIPWMRLRVLQTAPVPFKPLQSNSMYYHTGFKPSPYPKLLHDNEEEYVFRAFNEAMTYTADIELSDAHLNPYALQGVSNADILTQTADRLTGSHVVSLKFDSIANSIIVTMENESSADRLTITFQGIRRAIWDYDNLRHEISAIRVDISDIYLLTNINGAAIEILSDKLRVCLLLTHMDFY